MSVRFLVAWILVVSSLLTATPAVLAIGHWYSSNPTINDRYYTSDVGDGSVPPVGLDAPADHLMANWGSFVSPHWILGAQHQSGGVDVNDVAQVLVPNSLLTSGGPGYTVFEFLVVDTADLHQPPEDITLTSRDIRLMKLADTATVNDETISLDEINQNFFRLSPWLFQGSQVTFGGFGNIFTGNPDGTPVGDKGLHWGQNVVSTVSSPTESKNLSFSVDQPGTGDYRKYEGAPLGGDSGSGLFFRDGWEWAIGGTLVTGLGQGQGFETNPITVNGLDLRSNYDWVMETVDSDLPEYTPQPVPSADTEWQGSTQVNWGAAANMWTNGIPTSTQNVWVNNEPHITSGTGVATAKNLFIGVDGVPQEETQGDLKIQEGGVLQVVDSIFIGVEDGDWGYFRQLGGSVESYAQYVGHYGGGHYRQDAGSNTVTILHVGRHASSAVNPSRYFMYSSSTLNASAIQIGGDENADGEFELKPGGTQVVTSNATIVGSHGNGRFIHSGGSHEANSLTLGQGSSGTGTYEFSGGALTTSTTTVGLDGVGSFVQTGGVHTTTKLVVDTASSYELSDGSLEADEIHGTIDFADGTATVTGSSNIIIDYSDATFLNASNADLVVPEDSLVFLRPNVEQPFGNVSGGVEPHILGTTLTIGDGGFRGYATISDPVVMTDGGYLTASDAPGSEEENNYLLLEKGVHIDSGTAAIKAETNQFIQVNPNNDTGGAHGIHVASEATLIVAGNIALSDENSALIVDGTLSVESDSSSQPIGSVSLLGENLFHEVLTLSGTSEIEIDLAGTSGSEYDKIHIGEGGTGHLDGELSLELIDEYVPAPRDEFAFIRVSAVSDIQGHFDSIHVNNGDTIVLDIYDEEIAMAVLYDQPGASSSTNVVIRATLPGDLNLDDIVDDDDYDILYENYEMTGATWVDGDIDGNGTVDFGDVQTFFANYERSWSSELRGGGNEIPEPSTLALTTLALLALLTHARRR